MARPTKSDLVYVQAMGRGLRPYPGKEDCLVLDYAPVDSRNVVMAGDLLGKPREQKKAEEKAEKAGVIIQGFSFTGEGNGIDGDPDELVTRPLHYLSASPYAWYYHDGLSTLGLGQDEHGTSRTLVIVPDELVGYYLLLVEKPKGQPWDNVLALGRGEDFGSLAETGSEYADAHGAPVLTAKDRAWQREPITEKQLSLLHKLMPRSNGNLSSLARGSAAKLITSEFARRSLTKAGWKIASK
jgi:hypothetical protein